MSSNSLHPAHSRKISLGLSRLILATIPLLVLVALGSEVFAASRTPIPRDQASDGILLCKSGGGEVVRTPSVVACCNEQRDGSTICIGCAPDGTHCANYAVRTGPKGSLRRSLMEQSPSTGAVTAPKSSRSPAKTKKNLRMNSLKN
jgi:hypothetical protein